MSRFNRPGPAPLDPAATAADEEADRRVAIQRLLRHYGPVLDALFAGRLDQEQARQTIERGRLRSRQALLDAIGAAPDILVDDIAGRVVEIELAGGTVDTAKLAGDVMAASRAARDIWDGPGGRDFPLTDRASMVATLLDAAARVNAFGDRVGLPPVRRGSLFDHLCKSAGDLAGGLLGTADKPRNLYNLTQSCLRHLSQSLDRVPTPEAALALPAALALVDRDKDWLHQAVGGMIDNPALPQPVAEGADHAPHH